MTTKKEQIERWLSAASRVLPDARVRVTVNADGTIDSEIYARIERTESLEEKLRVMEDELRDGRLSNTWTSIGFRFEPSARVSIKNDYNRHRGLYQVFSNYYKNPPEAIAVVDDIVSGRFEKGKHVPGMRDRGYRKPIQALVRVHWNSYGMKPPREGGK